MGRISAGDSGIRVKGLSELNRTLRALGPEVQRELRDANRSVAGFVADDARAAAHRVGGVAAKAASSILAAGSTTWAGVSLGGTAAPYAGGAEFGGGARPRTRQFEPWRGSGASAGYFLYPTIRADGDRIEHEYESSVDSLMRKHGLL